MLSWTRIDWSYLLGDEGNEPPEAEDKKPL
jgi:hypothetical protein